MSPPPGAKAATLPARFLFANLDFRLGSLKTDDGGVTLPLLGAQVS
jgi:hypothetical protein